MELLVMEKKIVKNLLLENEIPRENIFGRDIIPI